MPPSSRRKPSAPLPGLTPPGELWHTGMDALAKAQAESSKAFDALMQQSLALQSRTQALAREQITQAAQRMEAITAATPGPAGWNPLETVFEQRVARALTHLGLPEAASLSATLAAMQARIDALEQALARLNPSAPASAPHAAASAASDTPAPAKKRKPRRAS